MSNHADAVEPSRSVCKVRLVNWSVTKVGDGYTPPEMLHPKLQGEVYGHSNPRFYDGKHVITSRIVSAEGRKVTTGSGTVYYLGKINPKYRRWLCKNRPEWDWRHPVTIIESEEPELRPW